MNEINDLSTLADELNGIAARLSGFQPILNMLSDTGRVDGDASNIMYLVGDAADRCNEGICAIAQRLTALSKENG